MLKLHPLFLTLSISVKLILKLKESKRYEKTKMNIWRDSRAREIVNKIKDKRERERERA